MSTTVTYKGETLTTVTNDTVTLETAGTWVEDDFTLTDTTSGGTMQAKTNIDPTTSSQTITPDEGYDGLSSVQINAMPTGTAGTPTATKGTVSNHSIAVTPSVTNTTGYITGSTINGTAVTVSASELDSGAKSITSNGNSQDVVGYATVDVAVPNSYSASDEGKVVSSGALVAQTSDTVTVNDTYDTTLINSLTVNVSGGGGSGLQSINLLDGVTLYPGYINGSDEVVSPTANKEVYTDYIDLTGYTSNLILLCVATTTQKSQWAAFTFYDSNKTLKQRSVVINNVNNYGSAVSQSIPSGATYMKVMFRTFGDVAACVSFNSSVYQFMDDNGGSIVTA